MPKRVQMTRNKPWRKDNPDAVIVARPTIWANPFRVGGDFTPNRDSAVKMFEKEIERRGPAEIKAIKSCLKGKDLACWCPLDQPCHADVLLRIANEPI